MSSPIPLHVWSSPLGVPWNSRSISKATSITALGEVERPAAESSTRAHATATAPELPRPMDIGRSLSIFTLTLGRPQAAAARSKARSSCCLRAPVMSWDTSSLQRLAGRPRVRTPTDSGPAIAG